MTENIWAPHNNAVEWTNAGGEVQMECGGACRILCIDRLGNEPIVFIRHHNRKKGGCVVSASASGVVRMQPVYSLVPAPRRHTRWVNLYPDVGTQLTKADADLASAGRRIACVEVTFTEGEGL